MRLVDRWTNAVQVRSCDRRPEGRYADESKPASVSTLLVIAVLLLALAATSCTSEAEPPGDVTTSPGSETTLPEASATSPTITTSPRSFAGTVPAPEFPTGLDWLNTTAPISLEELRGKIVLLDFWTYGCINCIHIIPDLQRLEREYEDELVVIGVHSAKFVNESATDNIREVVIRYGINHPVVNDRDFVVWSTWGAQAWPTVALIDPVGNVVGTLAGEGVYQTVQPIIDGLITEFADTIDRTPFEVQPESSTRPNTVLAYPGKVAVDASGAKLFVSDTGHNRVLGVDAASGEITAVYGRGDAGFRSGDALAAAFNAPQGLAYDEESGTLYVADTNNHAIRAIDTTTGSVTTVAGIGALGWPPAAGLLPDVRLNSPWGLAFRDGKLWVAMAGFHQIWVVDPAGGTASPVVGNALEGVTNGLLTEAELAQPSGLAFDDTGRLYFADSESSSIRWADVLTDGGSTGLLAGSDRDLFTFGDEDGTGNDVLLQHPLGIVWDEESSELIIADTYNSKIKRIDPASGATTTFVGDGHGWADGDDPRFYEPGGLAIANGTLYVADTNNHVVRTVDLDTGSTKTLVLHGIEEFNPPPDNDDYEGTIIELPPTELAAGAGGISLDIELPPDHKLNDEAPSSVSFHISGQVATIADGPDVSITGAALPVVIPATFSVGSGTVTADMTLLYCNDGAEGLCIVEQLRFIQPLTVTDGGQSTLHLPYAVTLPGFAES
jgi:DNA-binding beta-propeller fold protein YncE